MANFSNAEKVRLKFQLTDSILVPDTLIEGSIGDAHTELLRFLDDDVDTESPEEALVMGETLLAGVHLYRSLASKDGFEQKSNTIGRQRIEEGKRFASLMMIASILEEQAWYILEPYLTDVPSRFVLSATDSIPVIGEG